MICHREGIVHTCSTTILVYNNGHVYSAPSHFLEHVPHCHTLRYVVCRIHNICYGDRLQGSGGVEIVNKTLRQNLKEFCEKLCQSALCGNECIFAFSVSLLWHACIQNYLWLIHPAVNNYRALYKYFAVGVLLIARGCSEGLSAHDLLISMPKKCTAALKACCTWRIQQGQHFHGEQNQRENKHASVDKLTMPIMLSILSSKIGNLEYPVVQYRLNHKRAFGK
jgi:hypothetical protein